MHAIGQMLCHNQTCSLLYFILIAYTATAAAFMVNHGSPALYETLDAVYADKDAKVCIWGSVKNDALLHYPSLWSQLLSQSFGSSTDLLETLTTEHSASSCNAVIIPISDYEIAVAMKPSLCKKTKVLQSDEFSFDIATVMFISPHLSYSDELMEAFDKNMINGKYAVIFERNFEMFKDNDFQISGVEELYKSMDYNASKVEEYMINKRQTGRLLPAVPIGSSSSSVESEGEYHIGYCGEDVFLDYNKTTLSIQELAFPLLITFIFSSVGLVMYLMSKEKKNVKLKHVKDIPMDEEAAKLLSCTKSSENFEVIKEQRIQGFESSDEFVSLEKSKLLDLLSAGRIMEDREGESKLMINISSTELEELCLENLDEGTNKEKLLSFKPSSDGKQSIDNILHDKSYDDNKRNIIRKDKKTHRSVKKFSLAKCIND